MESINQTLVSITEDIKDIKAQLNILLQNQANISVKWIDSQDVMLMLHISKRKLQYLRNKKAIPFSRINNKFYYKASDIDDYLSRHYNQAI